MKFLNIDLLKLNPLNKKIYGEESIDEKFVEDVKEKGILSPIVVTPDNLVISGHQRLRIAKFLGMKEVPVEVKEFKSKNEEDLALISFNKTRIKNYEQEMREIDEEKKVRLEMGQGVSSKEIAESRNMSRGTYHRKQFLWNQANEGNMTAQKQRQLVNEGKTTVDNAYRKVLAFNNEIRTIESRKEISKLGAVLENSQLLYPGDFKEVLDFIPNDTVDAIITDPPYPLKDIDCWNELAQFALKKLRPGGWLVAYSGQMHLPEVMSRLRREFDNKILKYYWTMALYHNGTRQDVWGIDLNVMWKPVLVYHKPFEDNFITKAKLSDKGHDDYVVSVKEEKSGHDWQQSESSVTKLIETFSKEGDFIVDPFAGSGTTIIAALRMKRKVVGAEKEMDVYNFAKVRLAEFMGEPITIEKYKNENENETLQKGFFY